MRATDGTLRIASRAGEYHRLVARFVLASTAIALALGVFLLMRRVAGAFSSPLPAPQLLLMVLIATAWAIGVRELSSRSIVITALSLVVLLMFALACSYPGARVIDWLLWPTAMFAAVLCPQLKRNATPRPHQRQTRTVALVDGDSADSEKVLQQLTRIRMDDGHEAIRALLVGEFAPGERQTTLYVAFCPPFERLPQVEMNVADDSDATLKLTQVLHNGAQLDVRLPQPATEAKNVAVEFFATDADAI